ncbi:MAG: glycoside hydrolase family 3 protein [Ignavibacteriales bacterium]|nr:MAG: glycoside hydrolase family 3 protein [Ignavibacteriales bacterium]
MKKNNLILIILLSFILVTVPVSAQNEAYKNPDLPVKERAHDLVSRMTLEEKISQMMNEAEAIPRFDIPYYNWWNEGLHGVARTGVATVFPQAIGLAATFNDSLLYNVATVISDEFRAKYNAYIKDKKRNSYVGLTVWSPNINIFRDPRWGRGQETYGEDPFLTSRMGVAFVKGLQGTDPVYLKTVATPKHYLVHSGPEPLRHTFNAEIDETDFLDTYAPAFEACVKEGKAYSIMSAYNSLRGVPISASKYLLTDLLRDKWRFEGYVVSDCGAIDDICLGHKYTSSLEEAAASAVKAGCELNCGNTYSHLKEAIDKGFLTEKDIDIAVERLMEARIRLGMFDPENLVPFNNISPSVNDAPEHRQLSIRVAEESIVLLKNENNTLPLKTDIKTIAVLGPNADNPDVMYGNYNGTPSKYTTPLQRIKNIVSADTKVLYALGSDCVSGQTTPGVIPNNFLLSENKNGLKGEYFPNLNLEGNPAVTRVDSIIDFNWDGIVPAPDFSVDNYSVRWTGKLIIPETGRYKLSVTGDDGFRLYLDDSLVINSWLEHAPVTESCLIDLQKGSVHKIKLEYFQMAGGASIRFAWYVDNKNLLQEAIDVAKKSDVIIYFGGISPLLEGEEMSVPYEGFSGGDRTSINLPTVQENLLKELKATGKPVIFVMLNGSALAVNWANENLPAILEAWYPGQEGGTAIANVLFGKYNPAGRLPVTFYKSVDQLPPFEDYNMKDRTYRYFNGDPLYPFGYGLSYTSFSYSNLKVGSSMKTSDKVTVKVKIKNTGNMDGDEVAQLYVKHLNAPVPVPIYSLEGFKRIHLKKGEERIVEFKLAPENLSVITGNKKVVIPGEIELVVGGLLPDKTQIEKHKNVTATIKLKGDNIEVE